MNRPKSVNDFFAIYNYIERLEEILNEQSQFINMLSTRLAGYISTVGQNVSLDCDTEKLKKFRPASINGHLQVSIVTNDQGSKLSCEGIVPAYTTANEIKPRQIINLLTDETLFLSEYQKYLDNSREIDKIH